MSLNLAMSGLYHWQGISKDGVRVRGQCAAENIDALSKRLADKQIILSSARRGGRMRPLSSQQAYFLLEQILTFLRSGLPLLKALEIIRHGEKNPRAAAALDAIIQRIKSGRSLSHSLASQLAENKKIAVAVLSFGERNGRLTETIERFLIQEKKQQQIRSQLAQAAIYPSFLGGVSVAVMLLLTVFVIPEFKRTYEEMGVTLSIYTRITTGFADVILEHGLVFLTTAASVVTAIALLKRISPRVKWLLAAMQMRLPVIGILMQSYFCRHFAANVGMAYQSAMPLSEALAWLPKTASHVGYCAALKQIHDEINRGTSLYQAVAGSDFFPSLFVQLIQTGEHSGALGNMLEKIEHHYDGHLEHCTKRLIKILEPAMILAVAACAGWIVITMYLPIFNIGFTL